MNLKNKLSIYLDNKIKKAVREILNEKKYNIKDGLQELALQETCVWLQNNVSLNLMFEDALPNGKFFEFSMRYHPSVEC